jgi:hypothetical protein
MGVGIGDVRWNIRCDSYCNLSSRFNQLAADDYPIHVGTIAGLDLAHPRDHLAYLVAKNDVIKP